jgi:hypothetical protein
LSSCCCSLLVPIIVHQRLDASYSQSKPLSQLKTTMVFSFGSNSSSLASSRVLCLKMSTRS